MSDEWRNAYNELNQKYVQKCAFIKYLEGQLTIIDESWRSDVKQLNGLLADANKKLGKCDCAKGHE